jgi:Big-like domain-containing protein
MPNLRDSLLPVVDTLRALPNIFGVRRFAVTIRRRTWTGQVPGQGVATDYNIALIPPPRVRDQSASDRGMSPTEAELKAANSGVATGSVYRIDRITPRYTTAAGVTGGYLAEQIRMWPDTDTGAIENLVSIVGDDGYLRECIQITFEQDRAFGYSMNVKEIDRPRTPLVSIAITPATPTIVHGKTLQLTCNGTFNGGATSVLTVLTAWSSSNTSVATVDVYGNVTAVSAGSTIITGTCLGNEATATVTVS